MPFSPETPPFSRASYPINLIRSCGSRWKWNYHGCGVLIVPLDFKAGWSECMQNLSVSLVCLDSFHLSTSPLELEDRRPNQKSASWSIWLMACKRRGLPIGQVGNSSTWLSDRQTCFPWTTNYLFVSWLKQTTYIWKQIMTRFFTNIRPSYL
jgi:hypothetical protein